MTSRLQGKRSGKKAVLFSFIALLAFAPACSLLPKEEEVLKPPLVTPQKESYNIYEVMRGTVTRQVKGTGTIESTKTTYQQFKGVTGKITEVHVRPGDRVVTGQPLITLENEGLDIAVLERKRDVEAAKLALEQAMKNREEAAVRVRALELQIAELKLDDIRKQAEGKVMLAETDGVISAMEKAKPGDEVRSGIRYVTIADPDSVRLSYTSGASGELLEVQVGMKAEIVYRDRRLLGTVTQCPASAPYTEDPQLSEKYGRTVYVKLDDESFIPPLGETADMTIVLQRKDQVIVVPRNALISFLDRTFVKVLEGESVREIDVEKGIESQSAIEIVKGLTEGQKVILQ
ncbi:efflux RND transporter periplasmic adaptor subunit [Paenibacillus thermotolerans]|uniref:efflux RND transporter periplasmic adaptor subunit n=1 Tax=Paenibacillus thermotolerans TaxID=3027807 RepID=UPI0023676FD9|nr:MULTISPECIES: biotin/lipoyl-binding protein [unclassified Paenibacillus]